MSASNKGHDFADHQAQAMELADRMPALVFEARKVSHTVAHGVHGRKRAGTGDTFWQFRKYYQGDEVSLIDWRRSASSQGLYIREKEWEAAHTMWLWPDLSPSMQYRSRLANESKLERGLVLMFALGQLLINSGERVGMLARSRPSASRNIIEKLAETTLSIAGSTEEIPALPPNVNLSPLSECVIFSDCLEPLDDLLERIQMIASQGVRGHVVQILDPVEETFPFKGRTEFRMHDGRDQVTISRAESVRDAYQSRLLALKEELKLQLDRLNWSFLVHHTDASPSELLLSLYSRIAGTFDLGRSERAGVVSVGSQTRGTPGGVS